MFSFDDSQLKEVYDVKLSPSLDGAVARFIDSLAHEGAQPLSVCVEEDCTRLHRAGECAHFTFTFLLPRRCGGRVILPPPPPSL